MIVKSFPVVTETFILGQLKGLVQRGHDVTIFAMHHPQNAEYWNDHYINELRRKTVYIDDVPKSKFQRIFRILSNINLKQNDLSIFCKSFNVFKYKKLALTFYLSTLGLQLSKYQPFDIIHCQFGTLAPLFFNLREIGAIKGKLVTSFRGYDLTERLDENLKSYRQLYSKGDLFLPVCSYFKDILTQNGCHPERIEVLYSGIDVKSIPFISGRSMADDETIRIISVGRLVGKKGFQYAIDAVASLIDQNYRVSYTIIGDGPLRGELKERISRLNIEQQVSIQGWRSHTGVIDELGKSHILFAPSVTTESGDKEGIPNVLKEAMAVGTPVIATDHSGIPELILHEKTGLLVPEKDSQAIEKSVQTLLDRPDLSDRLIRNAREYVEAEFDSDILNDKLVQLYGNLMANGNNLFEHRALSYETRI